MRLNRPIDTSGFVGGDLRDLDGISAFGAVVRISRLNAFGRADQFAAFGFRLLHTEDVSKVLSLSERRKQAVVQSLGCDAQISDWWEIDRWMPFAHDNVWEKLRWRLRICPTCMRHGYHTLLFQMPWIDRCPWHRTAVIDACRRCKEQFANANSVMWPLMRCKCGLDYVDSRATLRGERALIAERRGAIQRYLAWAVQSRERCTLIAPAEADDCGLTAINQLVDTSQLDASLFGGGVERDARQHRRVFEAPSEPFAPKTDLDDVRLCTASFTPGLAGLADLPRSFLAPMQKVTQHVLQGVPLTAFSRSENIAFFRDPATTAGQIETRRELLFLPVHECGRSVYLDLQTLQRSALRLLCDFTSTTLTSATELAAIPVSTRTVAMRVIRQLLARAYADGLTHVVGRHAPAVFDHRRIRSGPRMPWVVIVRGDHGVEQVRATWSPRRPWPDRR